MAKRKYYDIVTVDELKTGDKIIQIPRLDDIVHSVERTEVDEDAKGNITLSYRHDWESDINPPRISVMDLEDARVSVFLRERRPMPNECEHPTESLNSMHSRWHGNSIITTVCADCGEEWSGEPF